MIINKIRAFIKIKNYLYNIKINYIRAEIIYDNFQKQMKNLIRIKENSMKKSLLKKFKYWKLVYQINMNINIIKEKLKKSVTNKYRNKLEESEKLKTSKETENMNIKKEISKNIEIDTNLNSKIKDFEEKEYSLMHRIHKLENEKKLLEEEMLIFSKDNEFLKIENNYNCTNPNVNTDQINSSDNYNKNKQPNNIKGKKEILIGLEKKIIEYEKKINKLSEKNNIKDNQMNIYIDEMNEIITKHEKTCILFII